MATVTEGNKRTLLAASFSPEFIPQLAAICEWSGRAGIQIDPHEDGGVLLTATDGGLYVCVHDADGSATGPLIFDPSDDFVKACQMPELPRILDCNGDDLEIPPPSWMIPQKCILSGTLEAGESLPISRRQISDNMRPFFMALVVGGEIPSPLGKYADEMGASLFSEASRLYDGNSCFINRKPVPPFAEVIKSPPAPVSSIALASHKLRLLALFTSVFTFEFHGEKDGASVSFEDKRIRAWIMPCGDPYQEQASRS